MEWLRLNEDDEVEFVMEEVRLVPEIQTMMTLKYNRQPGDVDGRKKTRAKQEFKYMYLVYSRKSPYADYSEEERVIEAKRDCKFPESWKEGEELKEAIAKYLKGSVNKITRSLKTTERFLEKFEEHLNKINLDERKGNGDLVHDPKGIMATLKQLPGFLETIHELEKQALHGIIGSARSRGDQELGWTAIRKLNIKQRDGGESDTTSTDDGDTD